MPSIIAEIQLSYPTRIHPPAAWQQILLVAQDGFTGFPFGDFRNVACSLDHLSAQLFFSSADPPKRTASFARPEA